MTRKRNKLKSIKGHVRSDFKSVENSFSDIGRLSVISLWIGTAMIVGALFVLRIPTTTFYLEATANHVHFTVASKLPGLGGIENITNWQLRKNGTQTVYGENLNPQLYLLPHGTEVRLGWWWPPIDPWLVVWGQGQPEITEEVLTVNNSADTWVLEGIPSLPISIRQPFRVHGLHLMNHYGAFNDAHYLKTSAVDWVRIENNSEIAQDYKSTSRVSIADLTILGREYKFHRGDALWFIGDRGEIREIIINEKDEDVQVLYVGTTDGVFGHFAGTTVDLRPTMFEWFMSIPLLGQGTTVALTLGTLFFATLKWWPKSANR